MFLLTAHWTTGRGNELMAPSYGVEVHVIRFCREFCGG
jgi:hypothetical protein